MCQENGMCPYLFNIVDWDSLSGKEVIRSLPGISANRPLRIRMVGVVWGLGVNYPWLPDCTLSGILLSVFPYIAGFNFIIRDK